MGELKKRILKNQTLEPLKIIFPLDCKTLKKKRSGGKKGKLSSRARKRNPKGMQGLARIRKNYRTQKPGEAVITKEGEVHQKVLGLKKVERGEAAGKPKSTKAKESFRSATANLGRKQSRRRLRNQISLTKKIDDKQGKDLVKKN